jgi:NhaP-type Na+/H+ or K+/H+ antiporter
MHHSNSLPGVDIGFAQAILILGVLLVAAAALSGWLHGTVLSISVLSVAAGSTLAVTDIVAVEPRADLTIVVVEMALVLTLFSDGLLVEQELLQMHWGPPARALIVAMPVTLLLLAVASKFLFPEISWAEAFLLGAVLSPTDPVVTSTVITAQRVPRLVRHTLNLESGLNDGLALPLVLFFLVLATPGGTPGREAVSLVGESLVGALIGIALALLAGRLLPYLPGGAMLRRYEGIYALGLGLVAFGLADLTYGNGLISAFTAGIALAATRHEIPDAFLEFNEGVSAIFQIVTFFVFGALVVATGWDSSVWPLVAFIAFAMLLARPIAVMLSLLGIKLSLPNKIFIAWFGPKGVASMLFALLVLNSTAPDRTLVFDIASFVILASILAHGLTDTVGTRFIGELE